jgi:hypothetical protein
VLYGIAPTQLPLNIHLHQRPQPRRLVGPRQTKVVYHPETLLFVVPAKGLLSLVVLRVGGYDENELDQLLLVARPAVHVERLFLPAAAIVPNTTDQCRPCAAAQAADATVRDHDLEVDDAPALSVSDVQVALRRNVGRDPVLTDEGEADGKEAPAVDRDTGVRLAGIESLGAPRGPLPLDDEDTQGVAVAGALEAVVLRVPDLLQRFLGPALSMRKRRRAPLLVAADRVQERQGRIERRDDKRAVALDGPGVSNQELGRRRHFRFEHVCRSAGPTSWVRAYK